MKNKISKDDPDLKYDSLHQLQKNKKNILIAFVLAVIILVVVITISVNLTRQKELNEQISTTVVEQTNLSTAPAGESYTFVGEDGITYEVNDKGTFYTDEDGVHGLAEYINISPYRTYSFSYENGTQVSFELKEDGTYSMTENYPGDTKSVSSGTFTLENGFENAIEATGAPSEEDFEELFLTDVTVSNPNNVYHVVLYIDEYKMYDKDGKEFATGEPPADESYDDMVLQNTDILDEFVFILSNASVLQKDDDGREYYDIFATGFSCVSQNLFADWSGCGPFNVSGVHYINTNEKGESNE